MPAFVNSNVGSLAGRSGEERTPVCPHSSKYLRKASRISFPVIVDSSLPDIRLIREISRQRPNFVAYELKRKSLPQQMVKQAFGFGPVLRTSTKPQTFCDCLIDQLLFRRFSVDELQSLVCDFCIDFFELQVALEAPSPHRPLFNFQ